MKISGICYNNHKIAEVFDIGRRTSYKSFYGRFMMNKVKSNPVHLYRGGELGKTLLKKVPITAGVLLFAAALVFTGCSNGSDSGGGTPPTPKYAITFSVDGGNGTLKAKVGGTEISSGAEVEQGKTVTFTAVPAANYKVKEWKVDGAVVAGNTSSSYIHTVTKAAEVKVSF